MSVTGSAPERISLTWRTVVKEISGFGVVGGICFLIDLALFQVLYAQVGLGAVTAKLLSTVVSMTVAYVGHRYWSFSHRARTGVRREYAMFVIINGVTLLLGLGIVAFVRYPLGQDETIVLQAANLGSSALGTLIRFCAYRRWVFPAHGTTPPRDDRRTNPAVPADDAA